MQALKSNHDRLTSRYSRAYRKPYGWAAGPINPLTFASWSQGPAQTSCHTSLSGRQRQGSSSTADTRMIHRSHSASSPLNELRNRTGHVQENGVLGTISRSIMILGANSPDCQFSVISIISSRLAAGGEYFGSHVAAGLGPFVVLLGQDGADKADDGVAVREDPDDVGPPPDFLVQPFLRVARPDLAPDLAGKGGEREDVVCGPRPGARRPAGTSLPGR